MTEHKKREAFLIERQKFVGGSEVADAVGIGYGCRRRLYLRKSGVQPMTNFHGNSATDRGLLLEEVAAKFYSIKTGRRIRRPPGGSELRAIVDREYPFMAVHSDYDLVAEDGREPGILSVKVPGVRSFMESKREGAPKVDYLLQANYEMAVRRRSLASFALVNFELFDMVSYDLSFDRELADQSRAAVKELWGAVQAGGPEPPKLESTDKRCRNCPYRLNCHFQELMDMAGKETEAGEIPVDVSLQSLVDGYQQAKRLADEAEELVEAAKAELQEAMGQRQAVEVPGEQASWRILYRPQKGRELFQKAPFLDKCLKPLAEEAKELLRNGVPVELSGVLEEVVQLPETMRTKFTTQSAPSRPLKVYEVGKQLGDGGGQKQLGAGE